MYFLLFENISLYINMYITKGIDDIDANIREHIRNDYIKYEGFKQTLDERGAEKNTPNYKFSN